MESLKLTSVIICTLNRPASFQRAFASVLRQDVDDFEIVVVDGSEPPVALPAIGTPELRVIHGGARGEGHARAAGLRAAHGELIAWCDDDDEWSNDHLGVLRQALLDHGSIDLVHADAEPRRMGARLPRGMHPPKGARIRAGDVLHRAAAARAAGGFDHHLHAFAAGDLWARIAERSQIAALERSLTIHHRAPATTTQKDREAALERLGEDWLDTARRRRDAHRRMQLRGRGIVRFNPSTWNQDCRSLIFQTTMKGPGSFPVVSKSIIRELLNRGVDVTLGPWREGPLAPEWDPIARPLDRQDRLGFVYDFRTGAAQLRCERVVYYHMWETSVLPAWQLEEINNAAALLYVPCHENARIARANGVKAPVRVLNHGVDPEQFPFLERLRDDGEPFTFGSNGVFTERKGIDVLMRAFQEEFTPAEPVRLLLKHTYTEYTGPAPTDPRISLIHGYLRREELLEFLHGLDAYVLPSRGEGFGLTGLEAMATGLPLIATNWSGPVEYLDPSDSFPLRYSLVETGGPRFQNRRQFGYWAEPDIGHLRELMRYLYEHREEGAEAGRRASARVHRDWTWARVADQIIADFDALARGASPAE